MKYLRLLLLLTSFSSKAQPAIFNISLTDSTKPILFVGVENKLSIKGVNTDESSTSIVNGTLTRLGKNSFLARINNTEQKATIKIVRKGRTMLVKEFETFVLPDITATIGYIYDSVATVNKILANPYLTAGCHCLYKINIAIPSFRLIITKTGADDIALQNAGNRLSVEAIDEVKKCVPGDKLFFTDIRAVGPDGRTRKLAPFTITIK